MEQRDGGRDELEQKNEPGEFMGQLSGETDEKP